MISQKDSAIRSILNIHSRYLNRWINILCSTKEYFDIFIRDYLSINELEESLFKFQEYLRVIGRGENITVSQIREQILKKDSVALKSLLEEYLLVPVDRTEARMMMKYIWTSELVEILAGLKEFSKKQFAKAVEEYLNQQ